MCTLGLSPKNPGWCCWVWAAVNLLLLCSVASAPHPSCLSCGLVSHARDFESGLLNLPLTPHRTLCTTWVTSPSAKFGLILSEYRANYIRWHHRAPDGIAAVSGSSWPGERARRWRCSARQGPEAACVPVCSLPCCLQAVAKLISAKKIIKQSSCVRRTT